MPIIIDNARQTIIDESGTEHALPIHDAAHDTKLDELYQWQSDYAARLDLEFDRQYRPLLRKAQYNASKIASSINDYTPDERYRNGTIQTPRNATSLGRDERARALHLMQLGYAVGDIPG